jgi:hypothetical protein
MRLFLGVLRRTLGLRTLAALVGVAATGTAAPAVGQGAGSAASTLLRVAPYPRPLSLGNAFVAVPSALAVEFNPAAAAVEGQISAAFQELPVGASAGAAAVTLPRGRAGFAVSLRFLDYGQIDVVEPTGDVPVGEPTGAVATGGELAALVGGGLRLGRVTLGLAGRWLRLDVAGLADNAVAADAGVLVDAGGGLSLGASYQNLGTELEAGRSAPLPRTVRVGAALRHHAGGLSALFTVEGRRREERTGAGVGLEIGAGTDRFDAVARVGYETRPDPGDAYAPVVFGGGVRIDRLTADFAYRALGPLGSTRQVGLSYRF